MAEAVTMYVRDQEHYLAAVNEGLKILEDGKGHSLENIFAWMDTWHSGETVPPPEPDVDFSAVRR